MKDPLCFYLVHTAYKRFCFVFINADVRFSNYCSFKKLLLPKWHSSALRWGWLMSCDQRIGRGTKTIPPTSLVGWVFGNIGDVICHVLQTDPENRVWEHGLKNSNVNTNMNKESLSLSLSLIHYLCLFQYDCVMFVSVCPYVPVVKANWLVFKLVMHGLTCGRCVTPTGHVDLRKCIRNS